MAAPKKKPAPKSSAKPMGSTKRETPGKDKTKTARERSAERRSQQQIFRSLDKEDYATVKAFAEQKGGNRFSRESRERRNKAQKAVTYLENKYPTYTKKVKEGKVKAKVDLGREVSPKDKRSTVDKILSRPKEIGGNVSTYPAYLGTKRANKYNIKKASK